VQFIINDNLIKRSQRFDSYSRLPLGMLSITHIYSFVTKKDYKVYNITL